MATTIDQLFTITDSAAQELTSIINKEENPAGKFLRIGVMGGGCSGLSYLMDMSELEDDDVVHSINGVKLIVKKAHALYLENMVIDYKSGLDNRGFTFENPNASESCGCGTSFAV